MNKMASDRKFKSLDSGSDAMAIEYAVSSPSHVPGDGKDITKTGADPYAGHSDNSNTSTITYKVYRRRFFGLFQLALLNLVVSWDVGLIIAIIARDSSGVDLQNSGSPSHRYPLHLRNISESRRVTSIG